MQDPTRKIAKTEEGGGIGQVVEYLPSKGEALSSNTNTAKRKKKGEERGELTAAVGGKICPWMLWIACLCPHQISMLMS
jgi:hypothetical protein